MGILQIIVQIRSDPELHFSMSRGRAFSELTPELARELDDQYEGACKRAARAIIDADFSTLIAV